MAGGNYGGNSIPTTPIAAADIGDAAYVNYKCTAAVGGASFTYEGVTVDTSSSVPVEMIISPGGVTATSGSVVFLCYDCSCGGPMSGITVQGMTGTTNMFSGVIIGGGGLNS